MKTQVAVVSLLGLVALCASAEKASKPAWHLEKIAAWKKQREAATDDTETDDARQIYNTAATGRHSGKFQVTAMRCCKLGERISRKTLSCSLDDYHPEAVSGPGNDNRKRPLVADNTAVRLLMKKLSPKVARCARSKYSANFTKCCSYNQTRRHELEACRRHLRRVDKRRCRKNVKKNFP